MDSITTVNGSRNIRIHGITSSMFDMGCLRESIALHAGGPCSGSAGAGNKTGRDGSAGKRPETLWGSLFRIPNLCGNMDTTLMIG
jgi:hypothetical protein